MKIGFLTADLAPHTGWGQYGLSLIRALHARQIETVVVAARNTPTLPDFETHALLPSVSPPDRHTLLQLLNNSPASRRVLSDCDVIHSTVEIYAPLAVAIAGQRPALQTIHGTYAHLPLMRRWPVRSLYRYAYQRAHLVCVSTWTERIVRTITPAARTSVVHNGVDFERYAAVVRRRNTSPLILSVGGVKKRKGTLQLIRAVGQLKAQFPAIQCVILGNLSAEAAYLAQVKAEIVRLGLQENVLLAGYVDEASLLDWYGRADVFAMPTVNDGYKFEGYGLVYLEAGAAGLPVIGTRDSGAEDAIIDGKTGFLVDSSNVTGDLADKLALLLHDADLAQRMGEAGRRHARSQTWGHVADQMIALYQSTTA